MSLTPEQQAAASRVLGSPMGVIGLDQQKAAYPAAPAPVAKKRPTHVFYNRMHNSTFHEQLKDPETRLLLPGQARKHQFVKDRLELDDEKDAAAIKALSAIADTPGCPIYTKESDSAVPFEDQLAVLEVQQRAGDVIESIAKAGQHVDHQ